MDFEHDIQHHDAFRYVGLWSLADLIKIEWLLIGTGLLIFIEGFFMGGSKVLIEAGKPMEPEV